MSENKIWKVIYEGTVREVYLVSASSKGDALYNWSDQEPDFSESIDGRVTDVMEVTDDE